jgi:hypothetical protein
VDAHFFQWSCNLASYDRAGKTKRKRVVLSIKDKLEILDLLDQSVSYTVICKKYGVGESSEEPWENHCF